VRSLASPLLLVTILSLVLNGCGPSLSPAAVPEVLTPIPLPPTATAALPTATPLPQGRTIVVTSSADSGPGTLRQALLDAGSGDTITFDPTVFPPTAPATIYVSSELPPLSQGHLTVDASNAGVVLDGSNIGEDFVPGLQVVSNGNTVQGLQIVNFIPGAGIALSGGAQDNVIGGDRSVGSGPVGQGNLTSRGDIGIGLWDDRTAFNTVTGNLIGTDVGGAGNWGNDGSGIWMDDGASHNTIGPDNAIAYNKVYGIEMRGSNTVGNPITHNSIHDNERGGIYLWEGGNTGLSAPLIVDFDVNAGTVAGSTCPNCTVEIFSDGEDEGETYEGQATADSAGAFAFDKGASFTGPHLTATATESSGDTSAFSAPTSGTSRTVILQQGNALPRTRFQPKHSGELEDNRIGQMFRVDVHTEEEANDLVEQNSSLGLKWARLSVDGFDWPEVKDIGYSEYHVNSDQDRAIMGLADNGIKITYTLVFWDENIQAEGDYSRFKTEEEMQRYLDYVRFIVHHFKGRIEYYEILNEPNIGEGTQQYVEVADYINLVRRTVPVIRHEDPQAKIVAGAVTPLSEPGARDYFFSILSSDVMPLVDAVSWHCHNRESPEYAPEYYYNYPSLVEEMKEVASAHGFRGEYIAEELHFRTPKNAHPHEPSIYSEIASAKHYARGIVRHLGMNLTTELALEELEELPLMVRGIRNLCTITAGARPISLPIEIQSNATGVDVYSFSLPDNDALIALWTDGVAVDDDPGVKATLTLRGFSAQKVMGVDVLNGFEQQMIAKTEGGNLIISDLLVKDYPVILRLNHTTSP